MKQLPRRAAACAALALLWLTGPTWAWACEMCWGARLDNPITQGIGMAMLLLIGMTGIVGGGIGAFFYNMKRRSRLLEPGELMVDEQGEIRTSHDGDDSA